MVTVVGTTDFFVRKTMFVKYAQGFAVLPGPFQGRVGGRGQGPCRNVLHPQVRAPTCSASAVFAPSVAVNWPEPFTVTVLLRLCTSQ